MTIRQIPAAPFDENAQQIVETDEDYTLDRNINVVDVTGPGVTIKMPANPHHGERHSLIASGGAVTVDGNGHPILGGGGSVSQGGFIDLIFSTTSAWAVNLSGAGGGPAGIASELQARLNGTAFQAVPWNYQGAGVVLADAQSAQQVKNLAGSAVLPVWSHIDLTGSPDGPDGLLYGADGVEEPDGSQLWAKKAVTLDVDQGADAAFSVVGPLYGFPTPLGFSGVIANKNFGLHVTAALLGPLFFGSGEGVFYLGNGTPPSANPLGASGAFHYAESGIAKTWASDGLHGTILVQQDVTGFVFIGSRTQLHGSNAGIQNSSLVANRAQLCNNQYGVNAGIPGTTGFKSRGPTIGSLAGVTSGDGLFRITAIGVSPDNVSIPLAAFFTFQVPTAFVPAAQGWVPSELEIELTPLAGPTNSHRPVFKVTSEGETQTLRGVRAGGPGTLPATLGTGSLWSSGVGSPNGVITGSPGDLYSDTAGGVGTSLYVKESGVATNTGWAAK